MPTNTVTEALFTSSFLLPPRTLHYPHFSPLDSSLGPTSEQYLHPARTLRVGAQEEPDQHSDIPTYARTQNQPRTHSIPR